MNGLVSCSRMGKEIQLSARQCRGNYLEALERQEQGWPLYSSWKSCLACLTWALKLEEVTSCQLPVASKDKEKLPVASNQLPVKAKADTGRRPKPQAPAPAPACLVCGAPAYKKATVCFDHLLEQTRIKPAQSCASTARYRAKKRGMTRAVANAMGLE